MGKEWYWRSSKRSSRRVLVDNNNATAGCMCAVFQLFDFQHFQSDSTDNKKPPLNSIFELPEEPSIPKGAEAPRNSLEEDISSLSSIIENEDVENFNNIQMGINQIKTRCVNKASISETNIIDSPGTKTPSLVARLMGLDLLPENNSPSNSNSPITHNNPRNTAIIQNKAKHLLDHRKNSNSSSSGTRSLPETPRISLARRSDVDIHHHRLSLQINKENTNSVDDLDLSRLSSLRRPKNHRHHNQEQFCSDSSTSSSGNSFRSPGYYAKQIVKQVKETVTTRKSTALADVTNTLFREHDKPKNKPSYATSFSCSPRLKVKLSISEDRKLFQVTKPTLLSSSLVGFPSPARQEQKEKGRINKSSGDQSRRTIAKRIMEEETFVFGRPTKKTEQSKSYKRANIYIPDKVKSKMTKPTFSSNSNNLLNINVVPTLIAVKLATTNGNIVVHHLKTQKPQAGADDAQESKRIKVPTSSRSPSHVSVWRDTSSSPKTDAVALREYIRKILYRTGVSSASDVSLSNWFSPSHPLDPSVFHRLELHFSDSNIYRSNSRRSSQQASLIISPRCNRKLTFDVVDELLAEILKPFMNLKPWTCLVNSSRGSMSMQGQDLIEMLCSRVELFPCKDCNVLEDIEALIDRDLSERSAIIIKSGNGNNNVAFEDEGEALVTEIEKDLVDTLVHETALILIANNSTF